MQTLTKLLITSRCIGLEKSERFSYEQYAHLLRPQLSNYELLMWFYNGLLGDEHPRIVKRLIVRYAMFDNLRAVELGKKDIEY